MPVHNRCVLSFCIILAFIWQPAHSHDTCTIPDLSAVQRAVDSHTCSDEYDKALSLVGRPISPMGATAMWDGAPFVVSVSSQFLNADELLEIVESEAYRIKQALGYRIVVPGNVLPLTEVRGRDHYDQIFSSIIPPPQQLHILCCDDAVGFAGFAVVADRLVVLKRDPMDARGAIVHELWHLLGFHHPGEQTGVTMSRAMMDDWPSVSTATDLAKLACIYDDADQMREEEPNQTVARAFTWESWEGDRVQQEEETAVWEEHEEAMRRLHETFCESDFYEPQDWCDD